MIGESLINSELVQLLDSFTQKTLKAPPQLAFKDYQIMMTISSALLLTMEGNYFELVVLITS